MKILAWLLAVIIHLAILLAALPSSENNKHPFEEEKENTAVKLIEVQLIKEEQQDAINDTGVSSMPSSQDDCKDGEDFYFGIGMLHTRYIIPSTILEVPPSYPAYKAGLRVGDIVHEFYNEPGGDGILVVIFERDGVRKTLRIKKENICFKSNSK